MKAAKVATSVARPGNLKEAVLDFGPTVLCITALNYVQTAARSTISHIDITVVNSIYGLSILLVTLALFALAFTMRREPDIRRVYTLAIPFIALVFIVLPYLCDLARELFMLVSTALGTMGTTYLFLVALKARSVYRVPASAAYGMFGPCASARSCACSSWARAWTPLGSACASR